MIDKKYKMLFIRQESSISKLLVSLVTPPVLVVLVQTPICEQNGTIKTYLMTDNSNEKLTAIQTSFSSLKSIA